MGHIIGSGGIGDEQILRVPVRDLTGGRSHTFKERRHAVVDVINQFARRHRNDSEGPLTIVGARTASVLPLRVAAKGARDLASSIAILQRTQCAPMLQTSDSFRHWKTQLHQVKAWGRAAWAR
jgi:hypothetical protein